MDINLHNRIFRSTNNTANGEVSDATTFHYFQEGAIIWATYSGGSILKGFLIGKIVEDYLEFNYQHLNKNLENMTGKCKSFPALNDQGKIVLNEFWQWTCKDNSTGESIVVEVC